MFFDGYIEQFKKVKDVQRVEYVSLVGMYQDNWYKRIVKYVKMFILGSLLICIIAFCCKSDYQAIILTVLIAGYIGDILYLKKKDKDYLCRITIRLFYDEWADVSIFLQSFIADMTREMPNEGSGNLLNSFINSIRNI